MAPRVIELLDVPPCEPNTSEAKVVSTRGTVFVIYEAKGEGWPDTDFWAALRFDRCGYFVCGGPNDEAHRNHTLTPIGLLRYSIQEIVDSPWVEERAVIAHKDRKPDMSRRRRHFVLALKENTFECIAESYLALGWFESEAAAFDAIVRAVTGR